MHWQPITDCTRRCSAQKTPYITYTSRWRRRKTADWICVRSRHRQPKWRRTHDVLRPVIRLWFWWLYVKVGRTLSATVFARYKQRSCKARRKSQSWRKLSYAARSCGSIDTRSGDRAPTKHLVWKPVTMVVRMWTLSNKYGVRIPNRRVYFLLKTYTNLQLQGSLSS